MAIGPKPGNQPDPNDMAAASAGDSEAGGHTHPDPAEDEAEEEAERLGDVG
jgi:hypothetical protein